MKQIRGQRGDKKKMRRQYEMTKRQQGDEKREQGDNDEIIKR